MNEATLIQSAPMVCRCRPPARAGPPRSRPAAWCAQPADASVHHRRPEQEYRGDPAPRQPGRSSANIAAMKTAKAAHGGEVAPVDATPPAKRGGRVALGAVIRPALRGARGRAGRGAVAPHQQHEGHQRELRADQNTSGAPNRSTSSWRASNSGASQTASQRAEAPAPRAGSRASGGHRRQRTGCAVRSSAARRALQALLPSSSPPRPRDSPCKMHAFAGTSPWTSNASTQIGSSLADLDFAHRSAPEVSLTTTARHCG